MSRPLVADMKRLSEAADFHRRVFAKWGNACYRGKCKKRATDAAHVIPRSQLGPQRYACAEQNGRPLCRDHHNEQEAGLWDFSAKDKRAAIRALNLVLKIKLVA